MKTKNLALSAAFETSTKYFMIEESRVVSRVCKVGKMFASAVKKSLGSCKYFVRLRVCSFCSAASKEVQDLYDITIVGGGMVGGSLACALGESLPSLQIKAAYIFFVSAESS